jgi:DtxR family Mn-dependent transcriptional regulator
VSLKAGFEEVELDHMVVDLATLAEQDLDTLEDLKRTNRSVNMMDMLDQLVHRGLARLEGDRVLLTPEGLKLAEWQLRRHRLAEVLFQTVFDVQDQQTADHTACMMEHILSPAITDTVCTFLGHPKFCPHGKPIPPSSCCRSFSNAVEPLVQPLLKLTVGHSARIVHIIPKNPGRLDRLSSLGIMPGVTIKLQQKLPSPVIIIGETTLAIDTAIADEIYVKKE